MADIDIDQFSRLFLQEADEQLDSMEKSVLEMEEKGENPGLVDEIFRMAHSLKGAAGSMGYTSIASLTHEMENLLETLREHPGNMNEDIIDLLFVSIDTLKSLKEAIEKGQDSESSITVDHLLQRYQELGMGDSTGKDRGAGSAASGIKLYFKSEELNILKETATQSNVFLLSFDILYQEDMQSMVAFLVLNNLKKVGRIKRTAPANLDEQEGELPKFLVLIETEKNEEELQGFIEQVVEKDEFTIYTWQEVMEGKTKDLVEEIKDEFTTRDVRRDSVRVDIEKLDQLMKLVGELVIDKERLLELGKVFKTKYQKNDETQALLQTIPHVDFIANELHESVMNIRMYPVGSIFRRFPRLVRDISRQTGKEVQISLSGEDTELDRTILQEVFDPMVHLIRNAIDHGIERPEIREKAGKPAQGTVALNAWQEENNIILEVKDDGQGIDVERLKTRAIDKKIVAEHVLKEMDEEDILQMIFLPGFSTSEEVSDISGRGVGMDVVKTNIKELNGDVEISSQKGQGTSIKIILPLTLAIIQALMVKEGANDYAVPLSSVIETIAMEETEGKSFIQTVQGREVMTWRGTVIPIIRLQEFFRLDHDTNEQFIVIVDVKEKIAGIVVEDLIGEQEIVIKALGDFIGKGKLFGELLGISGATIKGDGTVALILDIQGMLKSFRREVDGVEHKGFSSR